MRILHQLESRSYNCDVCQIRTAKLVVLDHPEGDPMYICKKCLCEAREEDRIARKIKNERFTTDPAELGCETCIYYSKRVWRNCTRGIGDENRRLSERTGACIYYGGPRMNADDGPESAYDDELPGEIASHIGNTVGPRAVAEKLIFCDLCGKDITHLNQHNINYCNHDGSKNPRTVCSKCDVQTRYKRFVFNQERG